MLVLSRKTGERLVIGDDIHITIVEIRPGRVRLGITAPFDTPVHREEVYLQIEAGRKLLADAPRASSRYFAEFA